MICMLLVCVCVDTVDGEQRDQQTGRTRKDIGEQHNSVFACKFHVIEFNFGILHGWPANAQSSRSGGTMHLIETYWTKTLDDFCIDENSAVCCCKSEIVRQPVSLRPERHMKYRLETHSLDALDVWQCRPIFVASMPTSVGIEQGDVEPVMKSTIQLRKWICGYHIVRGKNNLFDLWISGSKFNLQKKKREKKKLNKCKMIMIIMRQEHAKTKWNRTTFHTATMARELIRAVCDAGMRHERFYRALTSGRTLRFIQQWANDLQARGSWSMVSHNLRQKKTPTANSDIWTNRWFMVAMAAHSRQRLL